MMLTYVGNDVQLTLQQGSSNRFFPYMRSDIYQPTVT